MVRGGPGLRRPGGEGCGGGGDRFRRDVCPSTEDRRAVRHTPYTLPFHVLVGVDALLEEGLLHDLVGLAGDLLVPGLHVLEGHAGPGGGQLSTGTMSLGGRRPGGPVEW